MEKKTKILIMIVGLVLLSICGLIYNNIESGEIKCCDSVVLRSDYVGEKPICYDNNLFEEVIRR